MEIGVHYHLKDEIKYNRVLLIQKAKKRALVSSESARNIVLNVLKNNKELHVPLDLKKLNSMVSKERKFNNFTEVKGYDIPMELQVTENNKRFLFYDSGMEDKNRVVIFTTEKNLSLLEFSDVFLCDGTFKTAPSNFEQIFTIQCRLRQLHLPMIFCFMKHKNESSYNKIFEWLQTKNENIIKAEKSIILDFELASYNALCKYFVNSKLYGCNFHLGQIVWRRVQALKFSSDVMSIHSIKLQVKMILALSFVTPEKVGGYSKKLEAYIIEEGNENVLDLFKWFKNEFITNSRRNKKIEFWNIKTRTEENIPRTTNSLEGYHRHLNTLNDVKQTSIIPILNELKNEQTITENKLFYSLKNKPIAKTDNVLNMLLDTEKYDPMEYLQHIALNYNWKLD